MAFESGPSGVGDRLGEVIPGTGTPQGIDGASPEQNKIKKIIKGDLESIQAARSALLKKIDTRRKMYNNELPVRQYAGRANVRVPFPYTWVQSMVPMYINQIFGAKYIIEAWPRLNAPFEKARNVKIALNYQMVYEMDLFKEAVNYVTALCTDGLAVAKIKWNQNRQTTEFHLINPKDFACDPRGGQLGLKSQWRAHKIGKTKEELLEGVQTLGYDPSVIERITRVNKGKTTLADGTILSEQRAIYEIWEWFGIADPGDEADPDQDGDVHTGPRPIIAHYFEDGNELLSVRTSPYGDLDIFVSMADVPDPYNFYKSKSELDSIEGMYEAASDIINQRLDNVSLNINGLWTYRKGSGIDVKKLVSAPWGVVGVTNHDDLMKWQSDNVTQNAYQEVPAMLELMKLSTGLQDVQRGTNVKGVDTYSGMALVNQNAAERPGLKLRAFQNNFIKRIGEIILRQDQMFMTDEKMVRDIGNPQAAAEVLHPNMMTGEWDICPLSIQALGNKEQRVGLLTNAINVARGVFGQEQFINDSFNEIKAALDVPHTEMSQGQVDAIRMQQQQTMAQAMRSPQAQGPSATPGAANARTTPPSGGPGGVK